MNLIDLVFIVLLALGTWRAFRKGFVLALFSVLALVAGLYGGIRFSDNTAELIKQWFEVEAQWLSLLSFTLTFLALVIGIHLLGRVITKALKMVALGPLNKIAGAAFGLFKSALIISVLLLFFDPINHEWKLVSPETQQGSLLYQPLHEFAQFIVPAIKESDFYAYLAEQDWLPDWSDLQTP